jgi:hypothetical protein
MPKSPNAEFNARALFSLIFWGVGAWFAISERAHFSLGGDDYGRHAINVDARGWNAIAIAAVFFALGIINLAIGIRGPARIPVFWAGTALLGMTVIYGIAQIFI